MQAVSFSELRKDMKHIMDMTKGRHEPTIITRKPLIFSSRPKNAQRILASFSELREEKGQEYDLID